MRGHTVAALRRAAVATLSSDRDFGVSAVLGLGGVGVLFIARGGQAAKEELVMWALVAVSPGLAYLVGKFLWRAWRGTGEWTAHVYRLGESIFFALKSERDQERHRSRPAACVVIDPLKREARAEETPASPAVLQFQYPGDFEGGAPVVDGRYDATWCRQNRRGRWIELFHHTADVVVGTDGQTT